MVVQFVLWRKTQCWKVCLTQTLCTTSACAIHRSSALKRSWTQRKSLGHRAGPCLATLTLALQGSWCVRVVSCLLSTRSSRTVSNSRVKSGKFFIKNTLCQTTLYLFCHCSQGNLDNLLSNIIIMKNMYFSKNLLYTFFNFKSFGSSTDCLESQFLVLSTSEQYLFWKKSLQCILIISQCLKLKQFLFYYNMTLSLLWSFIQHMFKSQISYKISYWGAWKLHKIWLTNLHLRIYLIIQYNTEC